MKDQSLSRRKFMQLGFAAAGGAAFTPVMDILEPLNPMRRVQQIGVMLPQSKQFPLAGANLLDGLKLASGGHNTNVSYISETIGIDQDSAVRAATSLLESGVKIVVGMVSTAHVAALQPLFEAHNATLIVATAGENSVDQIHGNVFYNSLHYWQAAYSAGAWAARHHGARGILLASFYESGFDASYAFEKGVVAAGGQIVGSKITHIHPARTEIAAAIHAIIDAQPDFVYAAYRGAQAAEFLTAYDAAGLSIPLVASAFMADTDARAACISAWSDTANTPENTAFMRSFRQTTGRSADAFAALGYETALWIHGAELSAGANPGAFRAALAQAGITGPRGSMTFDAATHTLGSGLHLAQGGQFAQHLDVMSTAGVSLDLAIKTGWTFGYASL